MVSFFSGDAEKILSNNPYEVETIMEFINPKIRTNT